jgi:phosphatidylglycerol lysyltransferase
MHEMQFMVRLWPFDFARERRYVVAEREGLLIGLAVAVPIYRKQGWFLEDLVRDPGAPNGTAELLVDATMRTVAGEGARYATLGLAPLAGDVGPVLSFTRDSTSRLYNFAGVRAFKEKLRPASWEPVYVAFARGELGVLAIRDVLRAFAPGGLVRFGLNSLVHQRTLVTALLAAGLVPWTLALLLLDTARWFPSSAIQHAWTAFDVLLIGLLFALVRRWRTWLSELVAALTALDAVLTCGQVLLWNVWTTRDFSSWLVVAVGCLGPLLAAWFFWTTRRLSLRSALPVRTASN